MASSGTSSSVSVISMKTLNLANIPIFTSGSNYKKWRRDINLLLTLNEFDIAIDNTKPLVESKDQNYYLKAIEKKIKESEKAEVSQYMSLLTTYKIESTGYIRDHIMKMTDAAEKLNSMDVISEKGKEIDEINFVQPRKEKRTFNNRASSAPGMMGRFQANPGDAYWIVAKKVLRYLQRTKGFMLVYGKCDSLELEGYTDLDLDGDVDDRKSTGGYIFMLNGGAVPWKSAKQIVIATSTMEAEFVACFEGIKQAA
nr:uncharacterized protein LOC114823298 [Malus domestica]